MLPLSFRFGRCSLLVIALLSLSACSWFSEDEMGDAAVAPALAVPPDLIRPGGDPRLQVPKAPQPAAPVQPGGAALPSLGQPVLPPQRGVTLVRDGWRRWLVVEAEPEQVWPLAKKFLQGRGYLLAQEEPDIGFMETQWKQRFVEEGDSGEVKASARERLRLRLEPGQGLGTSEVYLTQEAAQREGEGWQLRAPDEGRSEEMLNRLARYLGGQDVRQAAPLAPMKVEQGRDEGGAPLLRVDAPFEKVWRRVGLALESLGFVIEDFNRSDNTYRIYNDISTNKTAEELAYGRPQDASVREEYRVRLVADGSATIISLRNSGGEAESTEQARHLINLLQGKLE